MLFSFKFEKIQHLLKESSNLSPVFPFSPPKIQERLFRIESHTAGVFVILDAVLQLAYELGRINLGQ